MMSKPISSGWLALILIGMLHVSLLGSLAVVAIPEATPPWTPDSPAPSPRAFHDMAHDAESNRLISFGGRTSTSQPLGDTWALDLNSKRWALRSPSTAPSPRFGHAMVYVPAHDRIVLFGGYLGATYSDETWAYDYNSDAWTILAPSSSPSPRAGHAMAYDAASDRVVLFGGFAGGTLNDETWTYDFGADTWTQMSPSTKPSARERHRMAYVDPSDRIVLFGGKAGFLSNETWTYDFDSDSWLLQNPTIAPSGRHGHGMDYDTESDRVVLFSGDDGGQNAETWSYDLGGNTWTTGSALGPPSGRVGHKLAYDSASDRLLLFGGEWPFLSGSPDNETWAYDTNVDSWTLIVDEPSQRPPGPPSPRAFHDMAYDSESDRVILFGGEVGPLSGPTVYGDTWAYDLNTNTWEEMAPVPSPGKRGDLAIAYDSQSDRVILFGGFTTFGAAFIDLNDTWAYDYNTNTWTKMSPSLQPPVRIGHELAYDSESDRVVLIGGHSGAGPSTILYGDVWAYDYDNDTWMEMAPLGGPTVINHHGLAYDAESDRVVLYSGERESTIVDDTWAYDLNADTWTQMNPASTPGPEWLHTMAYDAMADRIILLRTTVSETWAYDENSDAWTQLAPSLSPGSPRLGPGMAYDAESDRVVLFGGSQDLSLTMTNNETWALDAAAWTPLTLPSAPVLSASVEDRRVDLSWTAPSSAPGITNYRIYRGLAPGDLALLVELTDVLSYEDSSVSYDVIYYYHVTAMNAAGEGPASNEVSATPLDTNPPALTIISPTVDTTVDSATMAVTGTVTDNDAVETVEIGLDGSTWAQATVDGSSWSGTLTLAEGSNTIHARATDATGNVAIATVVDIVYDPPEPPPPPPPPGPDLVLLAIGGGAVAAAVALGVLLLRRRSRGE